MHQGLSEAYAARILTKAVVDGRSAELLDCLFDGGSVTIDPEGRLCLATREQLEALGRRP
jgi:hypothetical protein